MLLINTLGMIQVINRALDILEFLKKNESRQLSLSEIADHFELNHSTCANIIKTLIIRGYVEKSSGYTLGPNAIALGNYGTTPVNVIDIAKLYLKSLKNNTNESCILAILQDNLRVTVHNELTEHELQAVTRNEKNAYLTATGRILIANLNKSERNRYIKKYGLPGNMWPDVKDEKDLNLQLDKIVFDKIAFHFADSDIVGIAVPIFNNKIIEASLGIYLPVSRFTETNKEKLIQQLKNTAAIIHATI